MLRSRLTTGAVIVAGTLCLAPSEAFAQADPSPANSTATSASQAVAPLTADSYEPVSASERVHWTIDGTFGARSLSVGVVADLWRTGWNTPEEWGRGWYGIRRRYIEREIDVSISNSIEAGLGALWGEEPRYVPSGRHGIWPRAKYALKTVLLTQRRDGHLAPAWGRYAGNAFNNVIENAWLPPSQTTASATVVRGATGFLGRMAGNLWDEFWPDARRRWFERDRTP